MKIAVLVNTTNKYYNLRTLLINKFGFLDHEILNLSDGTQDIIDAYTEAMNITHSNSVSTIFFSYLGFGCDDGKVMTNDTFNEIISNIHPETQCICLIDALYRLNKIQSNILFITSKLDSIHNIGLLTGAFINVYDNNLSIQELLERLSININQNSKFKN